MEAAFRRRRAQGRAHGDGPRIWRGAAVSTRFVRYLSRNTPRARRQTRGAALAIPSAAASDSGKFALSRFPKGSHELDRGPGWQEPGQREIAPVGPRSARMGQVVDRRPRRDLTYNTRFGWLILPRLS